MKWSENGFSRSIFFIASIFLFLSISIIAIWRMQPPAPVGPGVRDRFSAEKAFQVLASILGDEKPHPVDSKANSDVRARIVDVLTSYGYQVNVQKATSCRHSQVYVCAKVRNIVALRKGDPSGKLILLSAHYDSVGAGPGASDDGSGVAVLLEIARLLSHSPPSKNSLLFLFTDGEEAGLLGGQAFAAHSALVKDVALDINIEARGTSGQSALFETGSASAWLVDMFAKTARRPLADSLISTLYKLLPNDTDLSVFKSQGIQGLNFAYGGHLAYYHTPQDNLASLNHGSLQQQGDNVYDTVRILLNANLPVPNAMGSSVYTDILGMGMLQWPASLSALIALGLLLIYAWASWRLRRLTAYTWANVLRGFLLVPLYFVLGGLTAYLLTLLLSLVNGSLVPWHSDSAANRLLLWSCVLLIVFSLQWLLGRRSSQLGLWIGIGYAWLLASLVSGACLPGISYLFILPSVGLILGALLALAMPATDTRLFAMCMLPGLPAFTFLLQAVLLIEIMLGFGPLLGVLFMGAFLGLSATFIGPLIPLNPPSRFLRYGGFAALLVIVASAIVSSRAAAYSHEQPQALNILYLQRPNGDAYILSSSNVPPAPVRAAMGMQAAVKPVFPEFNYSYFAESVASVALPAANLTILSQTQTKQGREIVVRIDAEASTQRVAIYFPKTLGLRSITTDGQTMDYSGGNSSVGAYQAFICRGDSCNGRQLTLLADGKSGQSVLIERYSPLIAAASDVASARNSGNVQRQDGDQSIVLSTVNL